MEADAADVQASGDSLSSLVYVCNEPNICKQIPLDMQVRFAVRAVLQAVLRRTLTY